MRVLRYLLGGALVMGACMARAGIVTIDPNAYQSGQIITDPTGGATLSSVSYIQNPDSSAPPYEAYVPQYSAVFAQTVPSGCTLYAGGPCAPTGDKVFGFSPPTGPSVPFWGQADDAGLCMQGNCDITTGPGAALAPVLLVNFAAPTDFVDAAIGFIGDPDGGWLEAFNSAGQQVGLCYGSPFLGFNDASGPSTCANYPKPFGPAWGQFTITTARGDISSIVIGGAANIRPIGQIQYAAAPVTAPEFDAASAGAASTLLLGGLAVLRERRRVAPVRG